MKLTELEPRWIHPNLFVFRCPHCRKDWLTCKNADMSDREQHDLYEKAFGEDWNMQVVPCAPKFAWGITGDFETLNVSPSIDASNSGHWHGFITNGEIR
jgi:hypothetical protein